MGDWLVSNSKIACDGCQIRLHTAKHSGGLWSFLLSQKKRSLMDQYDIVIGLNNDENLSAEKMGLLEKSAVFNQSPMAILADTQKVPVKKFPKSWKSFVKSYPKSLIIQDPRLSSPGLLLLRVTQQTSVLSLTDLQTITSQSYPSWSAAYEAFQAGAAPFIWTFATSEAYHLCSEKSSALKKRYKTVPLAEGYPLQHEYISLLNKKNKSRSSEAVYNFLVGTEAQQEIYLKNWMLPAHSKTMPPNCFKNMTSTKTFTLNPVLDEKQLLEWKDLWSL